MAKDKHAEPTKADKPTDAMDSIDRDDLSDLGDLSQFEPADSAFSVRNKKKAKRMEDAGPLTITSLMDILTILLVFLLKSYSTDPVNVTQSDVLKLPDSSAQLPAEEAVPIAITKTQILVNDKPVVELMDGKVDPSQKPEGDKGFRITALHDALLEEKTKQERIAKHNSAQAFKGLAFVVADKETNFKTLNEVLATAGMASFSQFKFAVIKRE